MKLVGWVLLYLDSREVLGKVPYGTLCAPLVAVELGEHLGKPYLLQPALYSPFLALEYGNQINQFQRNGDLRSSCCLVDKVRWRPGAVITGPPFPAVELFLDERAGILEQG